jgi:hypothetical protein
VQAYSRIARSRAVIFGVDWFPPMTKRVGRPRQRERNKDEMRRRNDRTGINPPCQCVHGPFKPRLPPRSESLVAAKPRCGGKLYGGITPHSRALGRSWWTSRGNGWGYQRAWLPPCGVSFLTSRNPPRLRLNLYPQSCPGRMYS